MPTPSPSAHAATASRTTSIGLFGARGYVGRELIALLANHSQIELTRAWSSSLAGEEVPGAPGVRFDAPDLDDLRRDPPDVVALALPNGEAAQAVAALEQAPTPPTLIIDLSADSRFDNAWVYGLPETNRAAIRGAPRIANPGCYATAMGLTLAPVIDMLRGVPHCFGVSGYSGAGSTPSERNDAQRLAGGVLPYQSVGHIHERELTHTLGCAVRFAPSVAPFERGIVMTTLLELDEPTDPEALARVYHEAYAGEPLVSVVGAPMPRVQDAVGAPGATIGGIQADRENPTHAAVVCVLDNLLKGAASQAMQNINLALGLSETEGIL